MPVRDWSFHNRKVVHLYSETDKEFRYFKENNELHCEILRLLYKDVKHFPDKPSFDLGNGDGTVNIRSLRGCMRWRNRKLLPKSAKKLAKETKGVEDSERIHNAEFPGVDHMGILADPKVLSYIKTNVGKMNQI